jgi:hypothetical protein
MARMTQINIDASGLQGVDLLRVPNQKIKIPKPATTQLNAFESNIIKAAISAAAGVSDLGSWAVLPQDYGGGSLGATMVLPTTSPPGAFRISPTTIAVTFGITSVTFVGVNMDGGPYFQVAPFHFGFVGALNFVGSNSLGISGAIDLLVVAGPISLLDGPGFCIIADVGVAGKVLFGGAGILMNGSGKIIGFVFEIGGGASISVSPTPITLTVSFQFGLTGHIQVV